MNKIIAFIIAGLFNFQIQLAFSQANRQLNNISVTKINSNILPASTGTLSFGSSAKTWYVLQLSETLYLNGFPTFRAPGTGNILIGDTKNSTMSGNYNTIAGYLSGKAITTGHNNTGIGAQTLYFTTTGYSNTAIGYSMSPNVTGYSNTGFGSINLAGIKPYNIVAVGSYAVYGNNPPGFPVQNYANYQNTVVGTEAMYYSGGGYNNLAIGTSSLYSNTAGSHNCVVGFNAMYKNTIGEYNVALGYLNSLTNKSGNYNTSAGAYALFTNETGSSNVAVGWEAMYYATGSSNTAVGYRALRNITTGNFNTAIGIEAGKTHKTGSYMTFAGPYTDASESGFSESTAIGFGSRVTASKQIRFGYQFTSAIGGSRPWNNVSDARLKTDVEEDVPGLALINKLKPVIYTVDHAAIEKILNNEQPVEVNENGEVAEVRQRPASVKTAGFVAQDVEKAAKSVGFDFDGVERPQNESDLYALRYSLFVVPLVKAVQELNQQQEDKKKAIELLKKQLAGLKQVYKELNTGEASTSRETNNSRKK
ncbi:tail fiber domain-containing protein [Pollutibacter soli]|uniref:tail fiber domain-containing protein n=1 Tax=Pollutibacter soli TaxID=3034157 RepID=UPI00301360B4